MSLVLTLKTGLKYGACTLLDSSSRGRFSLWFSEFDLNFSWVKRLDQNYYQYCCLLGYWPSSRRDILIFKDLYSSVWIVNHGQVKEMSFYMLKLNMAYSLLQEVSPSFTTWQKHLLFLIRFPDPWDIKECLSASFELADFWELYAGQVMKLESNLNVKRTLLVKFMWKETGLEGTIL